MDDDLLFSPFAFTSGGQMARAAPPDLLTIVTNHSIFSQPDAETCWRSGGKRLMADAAAHICLGHLLFVKHRRKQADESTTIARTTAPSSDKGRMKSAGTGHQPAKVNPAAT